MAYVAEKHLRASNHVKIVVIAPNVSERMSGEAIKAYQYLGCLLQSGRQVTLITHARSRAYCDFDARLKVIFIEDDFWQKFFWTIVVLRPLIDVAFFLAVRRVVKTMAESDPQTVFHYLGPVSPITPRFPLSGARNLLGPITGNIYFPKSLRGREPLSLRWRRWAHAPVQILSAILLNDRSRFKKILVSGGERTRRSLAGSGAKESQMADVVDSGISEKILSRAPIAHHGENFRFVSFGRLVPHKGVDLAVRAIAQTKTPATLDIFGQGPEEERLRDLIASLKLGERVRLRGWLASHDQLVDELAAYRAFVFPSMAEANGIVVQEAMALGLPVICLDWGGPGVLLKGNEAALVAPRSPEFIVAEIAARMDRLGKDGDFAARQADICLQFARHNYRWSVVGESWVGSLAD